MTAQGWGREGSRRWHYYRDRMPICYQRSQYRENGWSFGGPYRSNVDGIAKLCNDCLYFVDEDALPTGLRGRRPEDEDAVADRQIKLARIERNANKIGD
jgi:hypothetical protein